MVRVDRESWQAHMEKFFERYTRRSCGRNESPCMILDEISGGRLNGVIVTGAPVSPVVGLDGLDGGKDELSK